MDSWGRGGWTISFKISPKSYSYIAAPDLEIHTLTSSESLKKLFIARNSIFFVVYFLLIGQGLF